MTFDQIIAANIAKGRLESEAIPCWLQDEQLVHTDILYSPALGGIKLQVRAADAERARAILARDDSDLLSDWSQDS